MSEDPRARIVELCRHFYSLGWASGTGGGVSIREGDRVFMAPSGVQKERLQTKDIFTLDLDGQVIDGPTGTGLKVSECAPLFFNAFRMRDAGAVLHSHSVNALLTTLACENEFRVTELEMIKGIRGHGYHDRLVVPIIANTARECDLADSMAGAIRAYPDTQAVLVQRHGVYVWGRNWAEAKTQAESYDYLFETTLRMRELGIDPERPHQGR
ncbi:MAG: methylthioribulose 1-phosphate dehydratase [Myxococcota bacterium]